MNLSDLHIWAARLERLALQTLASSDLPRPAHLFRDELNHHRLLDELLITHAQLARDLDARLSDHTRAQLSDLLRSPSAPVLPHSSSPASALTPDILLWSALVGCDADLSSILLSSAPPTAAAPVVSLPPATSLEVSTHIQLSSLHALAWHSLRAPALNLRPRIELAIDYLLDSIQPDNATNYPWAVAVFILDSLTRPHTDSLLFAQTLLHNCQVAYARPDRLSAWILLDSSSFLNAALP